MIARAARVWFVGSLMFVRLISGDDLHIPYADFARLRSATSKQRDNLVISSDGEGIHWPDLDEDLSVSGLVRDYGAKS